MADRPPLQLPGSIASLPIPPGKKAEDYLIAYKGIAYRSISTIASDVASIELKLYRRRMKRGQLDIEEVDEHEALSLLSFVNDFSTQYDLFEATQVFLETSGEAFWLFLRDAKRRPSEIWTLRPDWVTILPDKDKVIRGYKYTPGGLADSVTFDPEDVIHFKYFDPRKLSRGKGTVQAAAMELDLDEFASTWTRNFFFNSAVPSLLFKFKDKLDPAQLERFMRKWESNFRGMQQSHKIAAISGDVETEPLSPDMSKMGLVEQRTFNRDNILAIFQVPKPVVAITDEVNYANAKASIAAYMERTIDPKMRKLVTHLNEFYLGRIWPDEGLFFDYADPVPQDRELQLKIYDNGLRNGWLTINEVREEENLIPVEGGDAIYLPFNLTPIGQAVDGAKKFLKGLFDRSSKEVLVLEKRKRKKGIKTHLPIPAKRLREIRKDFDQRKLKVEVTKLLSAAIKTSEDEIRRESVWKQLIAKTDVWEDVFAQKVVKLFNAQREEVQTNVHNTKKAYKYKTDIGAYLFDLASENAKWQTELEPLIRDIIKTQGKDTLNFLGLPQDMDITQENVIKYIAEEAGGLIKGINEFTLASLRKTLAEGVKEGEGVDELTDRVLSVFDSASSSRAETIARTEVLRASNFATEEAYKQSKVVKKKEWLTAIDERVCPICQAMDTKIIEVGEEFKTSEGNTPIPPAHPNCRCTLIPVIE